MYKIISENLGICVPSASPNFASETISVIIPFEVWKSDYLAACMSATRLEFYIDGSDTYVPSATYNLVNWQSCEKLWDGMKMTWHTYARDRLDDMQFKLDEMSAKLEESKEALEASQTRVKVLTQAMLDLAATYADLSEEKAKEENLSDPVSFSVANPSEKITSLGGEYLGGEIFSVTAYSGNSTDGNDALSSCTVCDPEIPHTYTAGTSETVTSSRRKKKTEEASTDD